MASTPSASALSAVLRCRGNIWARNPPNKRPATSAYSLRLTGGSPAERTRLNQASAWEAFLQADRVLGGRRLNVAYKSPRVDGKMLREKDARGINKLCHTQLSQSAAGDARSAVHGVQNALVRQLARRPTSNLLGIDKCSQIIIKCKTCTTHVCKIVFVQESNDFPVGQISCFVLTGWSTLKRTCLSLTALVSGFMYLRLAVLGRSSSSPGDAPQHHNIQNNALQTNGQTHSPTAPTSSKDNNSGPSSGQSLPGDRPD